MKSRFLSLLVVSMLLLSSYGVVLADTPTPTPVCGGHNGPDPCWQPSEEELAREKAKEQQAEGYFREHVLGGQPNAIGPNVIPGSSKDLYVGADGQFKEPNDYAHRNYCGPAASQVVIRARTSNVPDLETVASEEHLNPESGVSDQSIPPVLNSHLGTSHYGFGVASSVDSLLNWLGSDVDSGWAMITSLKTYGPDGYLGGWVLNAAHIVALRGYSAPVSGGVSVHYVDTASQYAGYYGSYFMSYDVNTFWNYVTLSNGQVW